MADGDRGSSAQVVVGARQCSTCIAAPFAAGAAPAWPMRASRKTTSAARDASRRRPKRGCAGKGFTRRPSIAWCPPSWPVRSVVNRLCWRYSLECGLTRRGESASPMPSFKKACGPCRRHGTPEASPPCDLDDGGSNSGYGFATARASSTIRMRCGNSGASLA